MLRRVGINLLYLVPNEVGGSEVYARRLLDALRSIRPDLELVVYADSKVVEVLRLERWADVVKFVSSPTSSRSKALRIAAELTWLPARLRRDGVDILHSLGTTAPPLCPVPSVVTVLDLIYEHFPETFPRASRLGLRLVVPLAARRAQRVIALSQAGKEDLVATLGIDPARVDVVHLGFGTPELPDPTAEPVLRMRYGISDGPLVVTVSSALRHKNLGRLLDAFARVQGRHAATLVVVGHAGRDLDVLRRRADALDVGDRVVFTGWLDGRDLEGFYRAATVFVYPSLMEGFGMPLLEAMRREAPVACSDSSALPEVAGDAAEYFNARNSDSIAAAIDRLLSDEQRRKQLVELGRRRHALFSWERTASATLAVYQRALTRRSTASASAQ